MWCGVPNAMLPKGKGHDVYLGVQVNGTEGPPISVISDTLMVCLLLGAQEKGELI